MKKVRKLYCFSAAEKGGERMQCHELRRMADSYLGDELLVETNHEVLAHLESCAACRSELAARRELRARLRQAILNAPEMQMRPEFAAKLRAQVRANANKKKFFGMFDARTAWLTAAACLVIAWAFGMRAIQNSYPPASASRQTIDLRPESSSAKDTELQPTPAIDAEVAVRARLAVMTEAAAGDHRNCAVRFRLAQQPIELNVAGKEYDRAYTDLTNAVMRGGGEFAGQLTLVKAHSCVFENRRFGHIILKHQGRLVSVLVTELVAGPDQSSDLSAESTEFSKGTEPIVATCSKVDGYQVACFNTGGHAVFVVSDLSEEENMTVARRLATPVYKHVARAESSI